MVSEVALPLGKYSEVGFLDDDYPSRRSHAGLNILGNLTAIGSVIDPWHVFFVAIGDNPARKRFFEALNHEGAEIDQLRSVHSVVSPASVIERGTLIMPGVVINAGARIGENVIINTGAIVEHDCRVGEHTHLAPGSILAGAASIGCLTTIGAGAVVCPGVRVSDNVILGAGAIATRDLDAPGYYYGAPAKWRKHPLLSASSHQGA